MADESPTPEALANMCDDVERPPRKEITVEVLVERPPRKQKVVEVLRTKQRDGH
jgi:hypothetical protein